MICVVVEDEKLVAQELVAQIKNVAPEFDTIIVLNSLKSAVNWFKTNAHPQLVFLDIQLSDGVSFDIFNQVEIEVPIIFTTAYNEYAVRAFKVNSIDYLLKPIDITELQAALEKFRKYYSLSTELAQIQKSALQHLQQTQYKEKFLIHFRNTMFTVDANSVAYFQRDELIYLVTNKNEKYILDAHSLEEIEEVLNPKEFFRANRQHIIQKKYIQNFSADVNGKLVVKLTDELSYTVDISREKASFFKQWLMG